MALEQLHAFRSGLSPEELGPIQRLEPDNFPLLVSSDLKAEHFALSELLSQIQRGSPLLSQQAENDRKIHSAGPFQVILESDNETRTRFYFALIERTFAYDAKMCQTDGYAFSNFFDYGRAASAMAVLFDKGIDREAVVIPTLEWFNSYRFNYYGTPPIRRVIKWIANAHSERTLPAELKKLLVAVRGQCVDGEYGNSENYMAMGKHPGYEDVLTARPIEAQIDDLIGKGLWQTLIPCEIWTQEVFNFLAGRSSKEQEVWTNIFNHCQTATSARPSSKWQKTGQHLLKEIGAKSFSKALLGWIPLVDKGRTSPLLGMSWESVDEQQRMHEINSTILRGLLWLCPRVKNDDLPRTIGNLAVSAYRKIRGVGPRAVKVGNAAVYALSEIGSIDSVGQLAMLKARVRFGTASKEIEKAYASTANKLQLPVEEIEEMAVPAYGLTEVGRCSEKLGDFTAELTVAGSDATAIAWFKPDGKRQQSVPAVVKEKFAADWKDFQTAAKDIQRMLPAQRERLDNLFREQKTWPFEKWRERYLDHPLVGVLARRLIWEFTTSGRITTGIFFNGRLVDIDLQPLPALAEGATVQLWHPIGKDADEIVAWRAWLDAQQIQQPFKQAHREVYLLTDAERQTRTYSNRFAAHLLRQHQFNALCGARGWKNKLRLLVDAEFPPATVLLPKWNLRAEFWVEGVGSDYGADTNDSGVFNYLSTDQVRFYRLDAAQVTSGGFNPGYTPRHGDPAAEPLPLDEIPPLVFSEVMRDVDLFVGVASVGNDPAWSDGGPEGRYRDYWQQASFGELNASAKTRREVLERLVPRLKIAGQCSFEEKFLVVQGSLRTYKIHLGSGNILMKPNDQYLCIVPKQSLGEDGKVFLPFEGDRTLSVIISKAFLLAADAKIKDESISRQILLKPLN